MLERGLSNRYCHFFVSVEFANCVFTISLGNSGRSNTICGHSYGRLRFAASTNTIVAVPTVWIAQARFLLSSGIICWAHQRHNSSNFDRPICRASQQSNTNQTRWPPSHPALSARRWQPPTKRHAQCRRDGRPLALRQSELRLSDVITRCRKTCRFSRLTEVTRMMGREPRGETGQAPLPILRLTWPSQRYNTHLRPPRQSTLCASERR